MQTDKIDSNEVSFFFYTKFEINAGRIPVKYSRAEYLISLRRWSLSNKDASDILGCASSNISNAVPKLLKISFAKLIQFSPYKYLLSAGTYFLGYVATGGSIQ